MDDTSALCTQLQALPVSVMSDVLAAMGLGGRVLASSLRPIDEGLRIAGPALCLSGYEGRDRSTGSTPASFAMDSRVTPGCIAVIATGGHDAGAIIGGNVGLSWKLRGCAGVVTDGGIRDVAEFRACKLPVFRRFQTPLSNKGLWTFSEMDGPISMPGQQGSPVLIEPGDFVHGDDDGIVVVAREWIREALHNAERYEAAEQRIQADIQAGGDRESVYKKHDRGGHIKRVAG